MARAEQGGVPGTMWFNPRRHPTRGMWLAAASVMGTVVYGGLLARLGFPEQAVATVAAVGVAALTSGIAGFAFSAICGAILFQFRHDTVGVVEIMLICSIANQSLSVWLLRRDISLRVLAPFVAGGIIGVPAGVWLLLHLNVVTFKTALGAILAAYGLFMLLRRPITLPGTPRMSDALAGAVGGIMGGFAATPGAAVSIWCGTKGWDKAHQRAVFQPFILLMQFVVLGAIHLMHAKHGASVTIPLIAWACVPVGLLGTWWGMDLCKRLTDTQFGKVVNLLLIVSGFGLVA